MNKEVCYLLEKTLFEGISPSEKEIDSDYLGAKLGLRKKFERIHRRNQSRNGAKQA